MEAIKAQKSKNSDKWLHKMPWQQAHALAAKAQVILVPYGSICKQHGYHLPQDTDYTQAIGLTDRLSPTLNEAGIDHVFGPPIGYSTFGAFTRYPGSISLQPETALDLVVTYCLDQAKYGCKKFYFVNTGISTIRILQQAQGNEALRKEGISIDFFSHIELEPHLPLELQNRELGGHANLYETELMLALAPEVVNMNAAVDNDVPDEPGPLYPSWNPPPPGPGDQVEGIISDSGVWGKPCGAKQENGEKIVAAFLSFALKRVQALVGFQKN